MLHPFQRILVACALVLSIFGWTSEAQAAEPVFVGSYGDKFCDTPIASATDLEARFKGSLAIKADGSHAMVGCKATPRQFLVAFQMDDPKAGLMTVADLPSYAHDMKATSAKRDHEYKSACLWQVAGGSFAVKFNCIQREIRRGEVIFASRTGVLVLMSNCANPGVVEVPPIVVTARPCVRVEFPNFAGNVPTRVVFIGRKALNPNCIKLEVAGVSEAYRDLPQQCPNAYTKTVVDEQGRKRLYRVSCNWDAIEQAASGLLGYRASVQNVSTSFYGKVNGTNVLYLPPEALDGEVVVCYGDGDNHSFGVRRRDYIDGKAVIPLDVVLANR